MRSSIKAAVLFSLTCSSVIAFAKSPAPTSSNLPSMVQQAWGLQDNYGINAVEAWKIANVDCSKSGVIVAVVDTGLDRRHPDLQNSLWVNKKELNGKPGVDDDGNGFVDDVNGWDFVTRSGNIVDNHSHGTHIAGIISAKASNSSGLSGVCPGVKIMPLRYYNEKASGLENLKNAISAIDYAIANGARLINYSGGGAEFSYPEFEAMKKAERRGVLVVAAAGNERSNADVSLYFPAAYDLTNILSITAINQSGSILPSSNWGVKKVHVAAPGNSIVSTTPGSSYGFMTGTSQATAYVSGVVALLLSIDNKLTMSQIKDIIMSTAKKHPQLVGKTKTGAAVSASRAVAKVIDMKTSAARIAAEHDLAPVKVASDKAVAASKKSRKLSSSN